MDDGTPAPGDTAPVASRDESTPGVPASRHRWWPWWVLACCLGTFVAKWIVNSPRTFVGQGDVANYFTVARNLAEGHGFVIDYVWSWFAQPTGLPTPSNLWWMPLPSILCALGMKLGGVRYEAAQTTMIAVSSLLPWAVYLLGRDLFRSRAVGALGALLATTFHLFLDQPCAPLSHGPYVVLAAFTLWFLARALNDPRWLPAFGVSLALTQLTRSDGIALFGAALVTFAVHRRRPAWRPLALAVVAWAAVMSPWWLHNQAVHGTPTPASSSRALFMRSYPEWYSLPENVTRESWLAEGWGPVLEHKQRVGGRNLHTLATGMTSGAARRKLAWNQPTVVTLMVLSWIGLLSTLRRRFVAFWALAALQWSTYTLAFTAVGPESFRSAMYSLYPLLVLCAARGLTSLLGLALKPWSDRRWSGRAIPLLATAACVWIAFGQLSFARDSMRVKAGEIQNLQVYYRALTDYVLRPAGIDMAQDVVMARNVHALHAHTGVRCVQVPFENEATIVRVANDFGVRYLLLERFGEDAWWPPALEDIKGSPAFDVISGPDFLPGGRFVSLYRIRD